MLILFFLDTVPFFSPLPCLSLFYLPPLCPSELLSSFSLPFPRSSFLNLLSHSTSLPIFCFFDMFPSSLSHSPLHLYFFFLLPTQSSEAFHYKLTSTPSTCPLQKCPLGWDQSAPGLTLAWGQQEDTHTQSDEERLIDYSLSTLPSWPGK